MQPVARTTNQSSPLQSDVPLVDLRHPDSTELVRGAPLLIEALWYFVALPLLRSHWITSSAFRRGLLRIFGAKIGKGVYIKPGLRVKFPWYLNIGEYSWLGEDLWIDNLAEVTIGPHACISQGAYLCTGNHDWSATNMKLFRKPIVCERGSWVGARSVVCPGVVIGQGAVLAAGSVATRSIPAFEIYSGNPASFVRRRRLEQK